MRIGIAGLGAMGSAMARRLIDAGESPVVWNRSLAKATLLAETGARIAPRPADLLASSDIVFLSLLNQCAIDEVLFGEHGLVAARAHREQRPVIIDTSTCDPEWTRDIADRLHRLHDIGWVDAPVSGGVPGARSGTLTSFVGGSTDDVATVMPLLSLIAAHRTHMGPAGAGQTTKLFNQMLVAGVLVTIAETVAMAARVGIEGDRLAEALRGGFADSLPLQHFAPRMAKRAFTPVGSGINLFVKDLDLAEKLAVASGASFDLGRYHRSILQRADGEDAPSPGADVSELVRLFESAK